MHAKSFTWILRTEERKTVPALSMNPDPTSPPTDEYRTWL